MTANSNIEGLLGTSMDNLRKMINVNTVVGDAMHLGEGVCIVPISKVSIGFGAGGGEYAMKANTNELPFGGGAGGGMSVKPVGFLVANNGEVRFIPVEGSGDAVDALFDALPGFIDKVSGFFSKKKDVEE
jgi:sporulation protein YtfJ